MLAGVRIAEEPISGLAEVGTISIAFRVESIFAVEGEIGASRGIRLVEHRVAPYVKNYDAIPGSAPDTWRDRFDVSNWGLISARDHDARLGSVVLAWRTPEWGMSGDDDGCATIWDLRVAPLARRRGIGVLLVRAAESWARHRACDVLEVETQNVNVPACRFYARSGFQLTSVDRQAYPALPEEIQLTWRKRL